MEFWTICGRSLKQKMMKLYRPQQKLVAVEIVSVILKARFEQADIELLAVTISAKQKAELG